MPAYKAKGKGKKAVQEAVSKNIKELYRANASKPSDKKRSHAQIVAIAYSEAKPKKKGK